VSGRPDLALSATLSLALHAAALGAVGHLVAHGETRKAPEPARPEAIEVVALSREALRTILGSKASPARAQLREATRPAHGPDLLERSWREVSPEATGRSAPTPPPVARPQASPPLASVSSSRGARLPAPPAPSAVPAPTPPARAEVQGSVELERAEHLAIRRVPVAYPVAARRAGLEGTLTVGLEVGPQGRVVRTWIVQSRAGLQLERAAIEALSRWRFDPARLAASGLGRTFHQSVSFQLN
jgi:TonB family protein